MHAHLRLAPRTTHACCNACFDVQPHRIQFVGFEDETRAQSGGLVPPSHHLAKSQDSSVKLSCGLDSSHTICCVVDSLPAIAYRCIDMVYRWALTSNKSPTRTHRNPRYPREKLLEAAKAFTKEGSNLASPSPIEPQSSTLTLPDQINWTTKHQHVERLSSSRARTFVPRKWKVFFDPTRIGKAMRVSGGLCAWQPLIVQKASEDFQLFVLPILRVACTAARSKCWTLVIGVTVSAVQCVSLKVQPQFPTVWECTATERRSMDCLLSRVYTSSTQSGG